MQSATPKFYSRSHPAKCVNGGRVLSLLLPRIVRSSDVIYSDALATAWELVLYLCGIVRYCDDSHNSSAIVVLNPLVEN
jgi:hypothetical protein